MNYDLRKIEASVEAAQERMADLLLRSKFDFKALSGETPEDGIFWACRKGEETLRLPLFKDRIMRAVDEGDVDFLIRLGKDLERPPERLINSEIVLVFNWFNPGSSSPHRNLYACSDSAITAFLNCVLKIQNTIPATRQIYKRLGLITSKPARFKKFSERNGIISFE